VRQCAKEEADFSFLYLDRAADNEPLKNISCLGQINLSCAAREKVRLICLAGMEKDNPCRSYPGLGAASIGANGSFLRPDCPVHYDFDSAAE